MILLCSNNRLTLLPQINNSTSSAVNRSAKFLSPITISKPLLNASNCLAILSTNSHLVYNSTYS